MIDISALSSHLNIVNILFFVKKNAVKGSAQCEYKLRTVIGSLLKFPIKTLYEIIYGTAVPPAAGPPNIIRRDAFRRKKCDNAIPMLNDGGDIFLFFSVYLSAVFTYGKWLSSGICPLFTNRQNRCTIKKSCQTKNSRNILIFI